MRLTIQTYNGRDFEFDVELRHDLQDIGMFVAQQAILQKMKCPIIAIAEDDLYETGFVLDKDGTRWLLITEKSFQKLA